VFDDIRRLVRCLTDVTVGTERFARGSIAPATDPYGAPSVRALDITWIGADFAPVSRTLAASLTEAPRSGVLIIGDPSGWLSAA